MTTEQDWTNWILYGGEMPIIEFDPITEKVEL